MEEGTSVMKNREEQPVIVLGITGGIAAYKSAVLARECIKKLGADVNVIMTKNAQEFVSPLTFQTLTGNPVYSDVFSLTSDWEIEHISLADKASIIVIAPATANIIGKITAGIADDLLTTTVMASKAPVLVCPAMNTNMYENAIVSENIVKLKKHGYTVMDAETGELACKTEGPGRMPDPDRIVDMINFMLSKKDLTGHKILVTAGPTQEHIDPVRYITNHSTGKMGYAIARTARNRGADVILISGKSALEPPDGVETVVVTTAVEMYDRVMERMGAADMIIKAAAVADYRPAETSREKIKKGGDISLKLVRNPDIIAEAGRRAKGKVLVGFAMETENLIDNAREKVISKHMDFIVANDITSADSGFASDTNIVTIIDANGKSDSMPLLSKDEVAEVILDRAKTILLKRNADG